MRNNRVSTFTNTKRDSWVEINLTAIENNIKQFRKILKKEAKLLSVVKADAYGCGALMIIPTLLASKVDILAVASIDEGIQIRETIDKKVPILVLGASPLWAFDFAAQHDITLSIYSQKQLQAAKIAYEKTGIKTKVHVKIDTGMNRIGVSSENNKAVEFIKQVQNCDFIKLNGIFTHLACAEEREKTLAQIKQFEQTINKIDNTQNLDIHFLNTAGIIAYQNVYKNFNVARVGIGIYGFLPDLPSDMTLTHNLELENVISLKGRITNIHEIKKGEGVSYCHTFIAKRQTKIATIPIGYADGIPRGLSNKIYGILNGKIIKQVGNITMDQMMFDISDIENQVNEGDIITLLGKDGNEIITIDSWSKILNTIHYELICRLKVRLCRIYTR